MGKIIKKRIQGMNWWAKTSLVLILTLATSVFMYEGWYAPKPAQAAVGAGTAWTNINATSPGNQTATVTSTGTFTAGAGTNRILLVAIACEINSANQAMTTLTATYGGVSLTPLVSTIASSVRQHMWVGYLKDAQIPANAQSVSVTYNTGNATNTLASLNVAVATFTGINQTTPFNASNANANASGTITNSAVIAYVANGMTFYASNWGGTGGALTITATPTLNEVLTSTGGSQTLFAGNSAFHAAGGTYANGAMSFAHSGGTGTRSALVVGTFNPAPVDSTPPTVATGVAVNPDIASNFTSPTPTITAQFTDAESAVTCEYTTNGSAWSAGTVSGSSPTYTCTANPTGLSGTLTINMRATSGGGGPTTATAITRTVDTTVPVDGTLSATSGNLSNNLSWTAATDGGSGISSYILRYATGATPPASCAVGTVVPGSPFSAATLSATHSGLTNGTQYSYRLCATDNSGNTSGGATASATPSAVTSTITSCGGCHGYTTTFSDGTGRNNPAGRFQGSHNEHVIAQVMVCSTCHIAPATETSADYDHSNGQIQMASPLSGGSYSKASPFAVSNTFTPGTCSGTSCHAAVYATTSGTSLSWGTPGGGCAACHTGGGVITASGPATGSHAKHSTNLCTDCHNAGTTATASPTTGHGDGNIDVTSGYPANVIKHAAGTYTGTCSTAACHANVYGTGTAVTPVWGVVSGCAACHSAGGVITASGPATGSHAKHSTNLCTDCHNAGTTATASPTTGHADGNIDVTSGYPANVTKHAAGTYTGTCSTAACHVNVYGTGAVVTPVWGVVSGCAACHSAGGVITASGPATGSHAKHSTNLCTDCHNAGTTATVSPTTGHADGNIDVTSGYPANVTKHAAGTYTGTCSTAACHANVYGTGTVVTPVWGVVSGCAACHSAGGVITASGPATGSHAKHSSNLCTDCHNAGTTATASPTTGHADGNIDVSGGYPANVTKHAAGTYTGSCSTTICHANVYGTGSITSPVWGVAAGCSACHSGVGLFQGNGAPNSGGHTIHMTAGAACGDCHTGAVANSNGGTGHADGNIDVNSGYTANVTKHAINTGFSTCTAAVCHSNPYAAGSITTNVWSATSTGCGACHKNDATNANLGAFTGYSSPASVSGPKTGNHGDHLNYARYICNDCHTGAVSGTSGGANHGLGTVNVIQYAAAVAKHQAPLTYLTNGCAAACHITSTWGTQLGCIQCHDAVITRRKGRPGKTLARVKAEFGLAWGHKGGVNGTKAARAAVTDADCIVCHLEGKYSTQRTSKYHADGNIDLRDPAGVGEVAITNISGGVFTFQRFSTSFAAGSRTPTGHTSNTDIANVVTQKFCLGCHKPGGATNTTARTAGGTATMPFGGVNMGAAYTVLNGAAAAGGLVDVKTQTLVTNSSRHPIQGPNNRDFPYSTRLNAPYNNIGTTRNANNTTTRVKANSVVMNCFDCHNAPVRLTTRTVAAHGNAVTLFGTVWVGSPTLCTTCHGGTTTYASGTSTDHEAGSAYGSSSNQGSISTCHNCHFSSYTPPARPVRGFDIHGFNGMLSNGGTWAWGNANGMRPIAFMRNVTRFPSTSPRPYSAPGITGTGANCGGNNSTSGCSDNLSTYTPGGSY